MSAKEETIVDLILVGSADDIEISLHSHVYGPQLLFAYTRLDLDCVNKIG